jgi:hypothetical protein
MTDADARSRSSGCRSTATTREIEREAQKLLGMLALGVGDVGTYVSAAGPRPRTPEAVRAAAAQLRDPRQRLLAELMAGAAPPPPAPAGPGRRARLARRAPPRRLGAAVRNVVMSLLLRARRPLWRARGADRRRFVPLTVIVGLIEGWFVGTVLSLTVALLLIGAPIVAAGARGHDAAWRSSWPHWLDRDAGRIPRGLAPGRLALVARRDRSARRRGELGLAPRGPRGGRAPPPPRPRRRGSWPGCPSASTRSRSSSTA